MDTLQFVDAMTGRLAWPSAALLLGLIFRRPVSALIERVRRLSWGDAEAELDATKNVQEAVQDAARYHLPEPDPAQKERIRNAVQEAVNLGFTSGRKTERVAAPAVQIKWDRGVPHIFLGDSSAEEHMIRRVVARLKRAETVREEVE
ncbi:hypothetical protein AB0C21_08220 [Spirillospora sp. NPDC049024]